MKVVIDTNCLIVSIPRKNPEFWLYKAFSDGLFEWLVSNEILTEYEEQLSSFYSPKTADLVLKILSTAPNVTFTEPYFRWGLIETDPDDNKFADLAISANANYLVTHDKHFKVLDTIPFPTVKVVDLPSFRQALFY
ncbi:putative toxin-antitoxin system toxin component, PIN family [Phaeodactylibacter sp.]|uniref:putative toxin-antitoxin system toxin component, PIN family n=1 Tax=Phaeodactylibacter sp. TaxID=1940289 RepID=UPI0025D5E405|nr:putative toxin-antitoxin system toxin component, PIN family [Phaeodactylibacter sp.]MCI4650429.1 putative toxin-antitoxin system toxin component, PIN family [Phaeodactylibacter sp.]MCI5093857.1 putative toxin-antitoxin system toxin component, PIN family [Phaeodactylibacter sp.]